MKIKLLGATREYFKDDQSAEKAIDIIMGILTDNGYRIVSSHIDRAIAMDKLGDKDVIVIDKELPSFETKRAEMNFKQMCDKFLMYERSPYFYQKHTHKRKSSRQI